jgi:hypothetical protein
MAGNDITADLHIRVMPVTPELRSRSTRWNQSGGAGELSIVQWHGMRLPPTMRWAPQ